MRISRVAWLAVAFGGLWFGSMLWLTHHFEENRSVLIANLQLAQAARRAGATKAREAGGEGQGRDGSSGEHRPRVTMRQSQGPADRKMVTSAGNAEAVEHEGSQARQQSVALESQHGPSQAKSANSVQGRRAERRRQSGLKQNSSRHLEYDAFAVNTARDFVLNEDFDIRRSVARRHMMFRTQVGP